MINWWRSSVTNVSYRPSTSFYSTVVVRHRVARVCQRQRRLVFVDSENFSDEVLWVSSWPPYWSPIFLASDTISSSDFFWKTEITCNLLLTSLLLVNIISILLIVRFKVTKYKQHSVVYSFILFIFHAFYSLLWPPKARPLYCTVIIYFFYLVCIDERPAMGSQTNLASRLEVVSQHSAAIMLQPSKLRHL